MKQRRFRTTRWSIAAATLVLAVTAAGCDRADTGPRSHDGAGAGSPALLAAALHRVHATDLTRTWVEFGSTGASSRAQPSSPSSSSSSPSDGSTALSADSLAGSGAPGLAAAESQLPDLTGIDPDAGRPALSVGKPPHAVGFLYGSFDTAAIGAKLQQLGYRRRDLGGGETQWLIRDDGRIDQDDPLAQLGVLTELNVVRVSPSRIVYGGASADLDRAAASGPTLADDNSVGPVASCLGTVVAAQIGQDPQVGSAPLGVGVLAPSPGDPTEVICLPTASDAAAQAAAAAWPGRVGSAQSKVQAEPWSALLSAPQATVLGGPDHLVRLTARPVESVQVLFRAVQNADLGSLLAGLGASGS